MKITDIRVRGGRLSSLTFVEVETDEGLTGIGVTGSPSWIIGSMKAHLPEPRILDRQGGPLQVETDEGLSASPARPPGSSGPSFWTGREV